MSGGCFLKNKPNDFVISVERDLLCCPFFLLSGDKDEKEGKKKEEEKPPAVPLLKLVRRSWMF